VDGREGNDGEEITTDKRNTRWWDADLAIRCELEEIMKAVSPFLARTARSDEKA